MVEDVRSEGNMISEIFKSNLLLKCELFTQAIYQEVIMLYKKFIKKFIKFYALFTGYQFIQFEKFTSYIIQHINLSIFQMHTRRIHFHVIDE